ncbi:AbrB family transcriptional regulator [Nocardioides sp. KR10-350]|uniref:AbrB family transcriptional regulator n=1 Tax=Nocardioides cheoyonin TaxID=3156615 RepID=UPI0032B60B4E
MRTRTRLQAAVLVLVVTVVVSVLLGLLHVPSPVLFGALGGGMAQALTSPVRLELPHPVARLGQGLVGVTIGTMISFSALASMGSDSPTIIAVTLGTVVVSLVAGRLLALREDVSQMTGAFAMIVGGASGVVAVARDLGADDRVVTVVQYLRVFVVLLIMPVVTAVVFRPERGQGSLSTRDTALLPSLAYVVVSLGVGLLVAAVVPVATASLLGPLLVAAVVASAGWLGPVGVPAPLQWLAYGLIGVQVGLRFTRESLAAIARMLPAVLGIMVAMVAATAAMGAVLAVVTPVDGLTAYLATTPGGLFAVLATAADSGSDVTYVMAVQLVRLLVILLCTPLLARWLRRRA